MHDAIPYFQDGDTITCRASAAVTGKRFVKITGAREDDLIVVGPSTAGANVFAVACRDAAEDADVMVFRPGAGIVPVTASGALTAGQAVKSDGTGKAIVAAAGEAAAGIVCDDAADGTDAMIDLRPHIATGNVAVAVTGDQAAVTHLVDNTAGVANTTLEAIPAPADAPATADALRDDLVANALPAIRNNFADIAAQVNTLTTRLETAGLLTP